MAYEYESDIKSLIIDNPADIDGYYAYEELEEIYQKARLLDGIVTSTKKRLSEQERKAKAFDEIKEFVDKKIKEEEEIPRNLLDDYDYGLNQAYNHVDDIIQEHMEDE